MTVDCLDSIADIVGNEFEDNDIKTLLRTPLWNGREIEYLTRSLERTYLIAFINSLANQAEFQEEEDERSYEVLNLFEDQDEFADVDPNNHPSRFISGEKAISGVLKKLTKCAKKAAKTVAHTARKVVKYVEEHKKEILIAVAVIAVAAVATVAVAALLTASASDTATAAVAGAIAAAAERAANRRRENGDSQEQMEPSPDSLSVLPSTSPIAITGTPLEPINIPSINKPIPNPFTNYLDSLSGNSIRTEAHISALPPELAFNLNKTPEKVYSDTIPAVSQAIWGTIKHGLDTIGGSVSAPIRQDPAMPVDLFLSNNQIQKLQSYAVDPSPAAFQLIWNGVKSGLDTMGNSILSLERDPHNPIINQAAFDKPVVQPSSATENPSWWSQVKSNAAFLAQALPFSKKSEPFQIEGIAQQGMMGMIINGINNSKEEAMAKARYLQSLGLKIPINGIYNRSHTGIIDGLEAWFLNHHGYSPVTAAQLKTDWTNFHLANADNPNAKIFQSCHSQGALHVYNALMDLPEEIRNRVIVVAIAPAKIIPREICHDSFNYASKNDIVHYGEDLRIFFDANANEALREEMLEHFRKYKEQLILLDPHEDSKGMGHDYMDPTFREKLIEHIQDYNKHNGEYE